MLFQKRNNKCHGSGDGRENAHLRGFTIIEMTIVLLVLAILSGICVPMVLSWMRSYRLGIASQDVATALQRARYVATSHNIVAGIVIKRETSQIHVVQYDQQGQAQPNPAAIVMLPTDITIDQSAPTEIDFDGRGVLAPIPTEDPVIRINGSNGRYSTVSVAPTGQVTVKDQIPQ
ncbi:MAG: pilus assembly FimT family protein [Blastocatellia bacterium]